MDDHLIEQASRYVDGDLDAAAAARLEHRAASDRELAETIESFRRLRASVRSYADRLEPPAELDAVIEPLNRAAEVPRLHVRPAFRWLATAAVVVLGVTVGFEVARRHPEPTVGDRAPRSRVTEPDRSVFELAPLPTAVSDGDRAVGATDRLLEERPTEPPVPEPPPLEVIGPLSAEADGAPKRDAAPAAAPQGQKMTAAPSAASAGGRMRQRAPSDESAAGTIDASPGAVASATTPDSETASRRTTGSETELKRQAAERPAVLIADGRQIWSGRLASCPEGRWSVVLEVRDHRLVGIRPSVDRETAKTAAVCPTDQLVGLVVDGLGDGEADAELVVGRGP